MHASRLGWASAIFLSASLNAAAAGEPMLARLVPDSVSSGAAVLAGHPDPNMVLPIAVALKLRDPAGLDEALRHLTDPHDPAFRHWLSVRAFAESFGPKAADEQAVRDGLQSAGLVIDSALPSRMVIDAHGRIGDLERLLHVRFGFYRHPAEPRLFLSPDREPTPDFGVQVLGIEGLDDFDPPAPRLVQAAAHAGATGSGPGGQFTAQDMRLAYYGRGALTGAGQSVGVFEIGGYNPADIATYFSQVGATMSVPIVNVALNGISVVCAQACHDAEQALDVQEVTSMAPGLDHLYYYGGKSPISILGRMASDDLCATLSVSWGWHPNPTLDEPVLKEMAAQGQTILVASGDDGFKLAKGGVWPADDAWSIAVGGTDIDTFGAAGPWRSERGWRFSGGGPSPNGIAIPPWQSAFVTPANRGSLALRNVPDIAGDADTDNFSCYDGRCTGGNGGTSYAAPLWAGFVALADQQAALAGRPSIGFFTPALYALATPNAAPLVLLHDEVSGFNGAYTAQPGFDLVTGLGSPFGALTIGALLALP